MSAVVAMVGSAVLTSASRTRGEPQQRSITELIQFLNSDSPEDRDWATRILLDREEAVPALRRALKTLRPESEKRAKQILHDLANRQLERYHQYARQGRVDILVAWLGAGEEDLDREKLWQAVLDAGWDVLERARPKSPTWDQFGYRDFPPSSYKDYLKQTPDFMRNQNTLAPDWRYRIAGFRTVRHRGDLKGEEMVVQSLIACDGAFWIKQHIAFSIVLGTGDVSGDKYFGFHHTVIAVDGDVRAFSCDHAVIVARNNVRIEHAESRRLQSHIYAGGHVEFDSFTHKNERVPFDARTSVLEGSEIKEGVRRPLDFVRFFETSDVGVEASASEKSVKVEKLTASSPLSKGGLKVGDMVFAIDGNKIPDADTFRRQLRRAYVSQEGIFSVRRDGKELEITVSFFGFELPKD